MKKAQHNGLPNLELSHTFEDNRFIQWMTEHGTTVIVSVLAALVILGVGYRFIGGGSSKAESDYINAENDFVIFKRGVAEGTNVASPDEALQKLQKILQARPDLNAKYDGLLAQTLINRNDLAQAQLYANRSLERTKIDQLPFYTSYSETTLLICNQQYKDALLNALQLKQQMQDGKASDILFAFNLLRIAFLEQQVGTPEDELKAWQTLKGFAKGYSLLETHFAEGSVSLSNYIEARERSLHSFL